MGKNLRPSKKTPVKTFIAKVLTASPRLKQTSGKARDQKNKHYNNTNADVLSSDFKNLF